MPSGRAKKERGQEGARYLPELQEAGLFPVGDLLRETSSMEQLRAAREGSKMSTNSDHSTIEELIANAMLKERRRNVGMVLAAYGLCKLAGELYTADVLDALATKMEHDDPFLPYRDPGEEG
jgi:hypothetical protein